MTDAHDTATATLPTPGAGPQMRMVEVALIEESLTNPRKHFDQTKLRELADSIAASGVHQPILLRPLPGHRVPEIWGFRRQGAPLPVYELVAGARRLRACRLAKVAEVPAMIRELTDEQALEIQVIENLQREDVTELEEAEGYEVLMRQGQLNADQVAAKIGKSRSYVYARLKVLDLCPTAREALREGKIDFSKGLLIARIPNEGLQLKALEFCTDTDWQGDPRSYRECARHVQNEYMLRLDAARFKITDASLVPSAGSCTDCTKRTGANPDLFSDVDSADVCTDPPCYHAKEDAQAAALKRAALERGQQIIEGREAKALMPSPYNSAVEGYLRLDSKSDSPTNEPLRKLIGPAMEARGILPTLVANPHNPGELVAVLTHEQVSTLLKDAQHADALKKLDEEASRDERLAEERARTEAKYRYEEQWRWEVLTAAWREISTGTHEPPSDAVLRLLARNDAKAMNQEQCKRLCKLLDLGKVAPQAELLQYIEDTPAPGDVLQLITMFRDVEYRHWLSPDKANADLLAIAADYGVDVKAVQARTKANLRAAAKAEKAAKAPAKPDQTEAAAGTSTPPPAAPAHAVRGRGKKPAGPAARASEAPKVSAAHASAQIAEALSALEGEQSQAPAAQGNEALPAPAGGERTAPGGQAGEGAEPKATCEPGTLAVGVRVRVLPTATGKKQAPHIGKTGQILRRIGPDAWDVAIPREKRGVPMFVGFHSTELEVVA
ncbi:MAG: ParB/RepB/Spo0J family partition protein [Burkholderiaceae bacterium]